MTEYWYKSSILASDWIIFFTWRYRFINHVSEYWYMGSILARSEMQKNKMEECVATGLYPFRVSSISFSVAVAIS